MDKGVSLTGAPPTVCGQQVELAREDRDHGKQDQAPAGTSKRFFGRWLDDWKERNQGGRQ
jgi:hypothetical protein